MIQLIFIFLIVVRVFSSLVGSNRVYFLLSFLILFLFSALRDVDAGVDTAGYILTFIRNSTYSHEYFVQEYFLGDAKDPVFYYVAWWLSSFGVGERVWLALISFIFSFSLVSYVKKYSAYPLISFLLALALGYMAFSFSGLRQTVALSFLMLSAPYLLNRNAVMFSVFLGVASLFHISALVFILAWFVNYPVKRFIYIIGGMGGLFVTTFLGEKVKALILLLAPGHLATYSESETVLNSTLVAINFVVLLFCFIRYDHVCRSIKHGHFFFNLSLLGFVFQCFSMVVAESFRIALFFNIFLIVLVTWALATYEAKNVRWTFYMGILFATLTMVFKSAFV